MLPFIELSLYYLQYTNTLFLQYINLFKYTNSRKSAYVILWTESSYHSMHKCAYIESPFQTVFEIVVVLVKNMICHLSSSATYLVKLIVNSAIVWFFVYCL